jgi:excisionase family DNA binding protein
MVRFVDDLQTPRLLTVAEVAAMTRVTLQTVRNWIAEGRVRGVRTGRRWRVMAEDVEAMLAGSPPPAAGAVVTAGAGAWDPPLADELLEDDQELVVWERQAPPVMDEKRGR